MNTKFVNKNCLVDAIYVTEELTAKTIKDFTGCSDVQFDADGIVLPCNVPSKSIRVQYGDMLIKDERGSMYPVALELFESHFLCIEYEEDDTEDDIRTAQWRGYNINSFLSQLSFDFTASCMLPGCALVLSNGKYIPEGSYVIYNRTTGDMQVVDRATFEKLNRR